ncbi:MAG: sulfurtransferase-like selenium metabolism protein YedF [Thiopseudomonas sp.]|nr:sulfurtransferase-like selenium metabolism protein YedF [Thiopseudomonas sp.]
MSHEPHADFTLDLRGESCPYPVIYTLEALQDMNKGELLQVITDCPGSFRKVPEEAVAHGYRLARKPEKNRARIFFPYSGLNRAAHRMPAARHYSSVLIAAIDIKFAMPSPDVSTAP